MQRIRFDGRRLIAEVLCVLLFLSMIFLDQSTKLYFENLYGVGGKGEVIPGFFAFTCYYNEGAAWGFLDGVDWAQTFFTVLTSVMLVAFVALYVYFCIKNKNLPKYPLIVIIAGTVGNFIDRLAYGHVIDFIEFTFGNWTFPIFNLADAFLTVGLIWMIIYLLFFSFKGSKKGKQKKQPIKEENLEDDQSNQE